MSTEAGAHEERGQCERHNSEARLAGPGIQWPTQTDQSETRHGNRETASDTRQSVPHLKIRHSAFKPESWLSLVLMI